MKKNKDADNRRKDKLIATLRVSNKKLQKRESVLLCLINDIYDELFWEETPEGYFADKQWDPATIERIHDTLTYHFPRPKDGTTKMPELVLTHN